MNSQPPDAPRRPGAVRSLLLISGSTRHGSINSAVLTTARAAVPEPWQADLFTGLARLPQFNPDLEHPELEDPDPPSTVAEMRRRIGDADALLFSTPECAGTMPGALKNLLEWTIGDTVMSGKPVGWINPSAAPRRAADTYATLATVLSYTGPTVIDDACRDIPVFQRRLRADGSLDDPPTRQLIGAAARALTASVRGAGGR